MKNTNMQTDQEILGELKQKLQEAMFSDEIKKLLQYINEQKMKENPTIIYLDKINTVVEYGEINQNEKEKEGTISLYNVDGLKIIYDIIMHYFRNEFSMDKFYSFDKGWKPLSTIGNNLMLDVDSTEKYDYDWFSEYIHTQEYNNQNTRRVI